jgi:uncharacterized repeat protein (TIGR03803 family)
MRDKALVIVAMTLVLASSAWGASSESLLYSFNAFSGDGYYPLGSLVADKKGNLYGATYQGGGGSEYGTVYKLSVSGGVWSETQLHIFTGGTTDGEYPQDAPLVFDKAGNLYGVTYQGGLYGYGIVFELTPSGKKWTYAVIHNFSGYPKDGTYPSSGLSFDAAGNMYGTTYQGGKHNYGTAFMMTLKKGKWTEKPIHSFAGGNGGDYPVGGLIVGANGYFYGATIYGGATYNDGTVYRLFQARGSWVGQTVYLFTGGAGGTNPYSGMAMDKAGNFYGTTYYGGASNLGTVYKLTLGKNNKYTQSVLYSFKGGVTDGAYPYYAAPILDAKNNIYGTTYQGGSSSNEGTVWELKLANGKYKEVVLHSFVDSGGDDGYYPRAGLLLLNKNLFGTTYAGGLQGAGTVFEVKP